MGKVFKYSFIIIILLIFIQSLQEKTENTKSNINKSILADKVDRKRSNRIIFSKRQKEFLSNCLEQDILMYIEDPVKSDTLYKRDDFDKNINFVTAMDVYRDYSNNEISADIRYRDKEIFITGNINSINRGIGEDYYLLLSTSRYYQYVMAYFQTAYREDLSKLNKGRVYYAHCIGGGMTLGSPVLYECKPAVFWIKEEVLKLIEFIENDINSYNSLKSLQKSIKNNDFYAYSTLGLIFLTLPDKHPLLQLNVNNPNDEKKFNRYLKEITDVFKKLLKDNVELDIQDFLILVKNTLESSIN